MQVTIEKFQEQIQKDPIIFFDTVLWCSHWSKQDEIIKAVFKHQRVTVKSCFWVWKTYISARIALAFCFAYSDSIVISSAPTFRQVENVLWRDIRFAHKNAKIPLGGNMFKTKFEIDERWYMLWLSSDKEENFQWFHAKHQLNIADEAGGIPAKSLEALEALMTWEWTKLLYIGNPTVANGWFFDSFSDDSFHKISISVFDTPNFTKNGIKNVADLKKLSQEEVMKLPLVYPELVTPIWAWDKIWRWWEDTAIFQSKVMAIFPDEGDDTLIRLSWIEQALIKEWDEEEWKMRPRRNAIGIDVARFWPDSTVLIAMDNWKMHENIRHFRWKDTMKTVGEAIAMFNSLWYKKEFDYFIVDDTWVGWWVTDRLNELWYNVIAVNNAESARDKETFRDIKAEIYWALRQAFIDGKIQIYDVDRLIKDISNIKYDYTSQWQLFIKSKKDMKKEGLDSPDFSDALALAFYWTQIVDGGDVIIAWWKKSDDEDNTQSWTIVWDIFKKSF